MDTEVSLDRVQIAVERPAEDVTVGSQLDTAVQAFGRFEGDYGVGIDVLVDCFRHPAAKRGRKLKPATNHHPAVSLSQRRLKRVLRLLVEIAELVEKDGDNLAFQAGVREVAQSSAGQGQEFLLCLPA